jgi:2-polyprenyl-3-methyl-5-hydroxy-6-metoxy-1,4-benzoquinol methylase
MITHSTLIDRGFISGAEVQTVLDFGQHAYADTFIASDQLHLSEPVFPLQVTLDQLSGHLQLRYVSSAKDRYNLYPYSYTSSNSATSRQHWDSFADTVIQQHNPCGLIVEIGSNDGYLLSRLQTYNKKVLGIDSSKEMCNVATEKGILTRNAVFDDVTADLVIQNHGLADMVIANNVLNHANDPVAFVCAVTKILSSSGVFVFEVPYWLEMMQAQRFPDMVYHEHVSYFTIRSVSNLLKKAGLEIQDFEIVNYHGGSLRITAKHPHHTQDTGKIVDAIQHEINFGLFDKDFYQQVMSRLKTQRAHWLRDFYKLISDVPGAVVIGVGAAAKANTWLTWHGLGANSISAITDSSKFKQGKFTPLTRIPITDDNEFASHKNPYALILSWNISDALKKSLSEINPNTRFISQ